MMAAAADVCSTSHGWRLRAGKPNSGPRRGGQAVVSGSQLSACLLELDALNLGSHQALPAAHGAPVPCPRRTLHRIQLAPWSRRGGTAHSADGDLLRHGGGHGGASAAGRRGIRARSVDAFARAALASCATGPIERQAPIALEPCGRSAGEPCLCCSQAHLQAHVKAIKAP